LNKYLEYTLIHMPLQPPTHLESANEKLPNKSWSISEKMFQALSQKPIGSTLKIQLSENDEPRAFRVIAG